MANELLPQVFQTVTRIAKSVGDVRDIVRGIYQPDPTRGLRDRASRPFARRLLNKNIDARPAGSANLFPIYSSPDLDTKGFTTQNCYVVLEITDQAAFDPLTDDINIEGVFLGSYNSAAVELDRQVVLYNGPGSYTVPLLARIDSMSTQVRFRLDVSANPARNFTITIDGMLVAGPLV